MGRIASQLRRIYAPTPNWNSTIRDKAALGDAIEAEKNADLGEKSFLLFDNHGDALGFKRCAAPYDKGTRFYQKIGLKDGLTLFQSLESPPSSAFGFALFIYSLVEGALTRVVILDERVAQATLDDGKKLFGDKLHNYQIADLFPLVNFRRNKERIAISDRLESAAKDTIDAWTNTPKNSLWPILWEEQASEGLRFGDDCKVLAVAKMTEGLSLLNVENADILLVHEGVADRLHTEGLWKAEDSTSFFSAAPFVVRTSGRGRDSRRLRNILPFLEFTELSENTYQDMNKPGLVKALLGVSGDTGVLDKEKEPL